LRKYLPLPWRPGGRRVSGRGSQNPTARTQRPEPNGEEQRVNGRRWGWWWCVNRSRERAASPRTTINSGSGVGLAPTTRFQTDLGRASVLVLDPHSAENRPNAVVQSHALPQWWTPAITASRSFSIVLVPRLLPACTPNGPYDAVSARLPPYPPPPGHHTSGSLRRDHPARNYDHWRAHCYRHCDHNECAWGLLRLLRRDLFDSFHSSRR
jgi:hypothetical protein